MNLYLLIGRLSPALLCCLVAVFFSCQHAVCQKFKRMEVRQMPGFIKKVDEKQLVSNHVSEKEAVKILDYLPADVKKDGTKDYTSIIQGVLDKHREVIFPDFPVQINDVGLTVNSDSKLIFQNGSSLQLAPSAKRKYEILRIHGKKNVTLVNPTIVGDRQNHKGNSGEWGMGISIKDSENVSVINPTVRDCWGDGIYLGRTTRVNENIKISGGVIDNNRRNGISIVAVNGLIIENIVVSNTNGVSPQVGIDFEPNRSDDVLKKILVKNTYLLNNKFTGMFFNTTNIMESGNFIDITVSNVLNEKSLYAVGYSSPKKRPKNKNGLSGEIKIENLSNINTSEGVKIFGTNDLDKVSISVDRQSLKN